MPEVTRSRPSVAVLGAGAGGIAMGVALTRAGYDYTIYEKSDGVGGTWRDNSYPGAKCDVPSHLYSYSYAPNPWWSHTFATQPEILAYLERVTDQFGVRSHVRSTRSRPLRSRPAKTDSHAPATGTALGMPPVAVASLVSCSSDSHTKP